MPPVSIMFKPASSSCNLACEYCFYHSLAKNREMPSHGRMSAELFRDVIVKAFDFTRGAPVMLSFQGGEPLIAGKRFFRDAWEIIDENNIYNSTVYIGVQTNGTLIDDEWCEIFKGKNALIGLSLDGDAEANAFRKDIDGKPTFDKVLNAAKLLQKHGVDFNILTVLTKQVSERINRIYLFFKKQGFKHLQFIPCLKPLGGEEERSQTDFYMTSEDYSNFLNRAFSLYTRDYIDGKYTSVRQFDNFVRLAHSRRAEQCGMNGYCSHQFVIEADGETYPCDFYSTDEYSMGNIKDTDFQKLSEHPVAVKFIKDSLGIEEKCKECDYFMLCRGGCKRERLDMDKCRAYKKFFPYALPHFKRMS